MLLSSWQNSKPMCFSAPEWVGRIPPRTDNNRAHDHSSGAASLPLALSLFLLHVMCGVVQCWMPPYGHRGAELKRGEGVRGIEGGRTEEGEICVAVNPTMRKETTKDLRRMYCHLQLWLQRLDSSHWSEKRLSFISLPSSKCPAAITAGNREACLP